MSTVKTKEYQDINTERELNQKYEKFEPQSNKKTLNYDYEKTHLQYPQSVKNGKNPQLVNFHPNTQNFTYTHSQSQNSLNPLPTHMSIPTLSSNSNLPQVTQIQPRPHPLQATQNHQISSHRSHSELAHLTNLSVPSQNHNFSSTTVQKFSNSSFSQSKIPPQKVERQNTFEGENQKITTNFMENELAMLQQKIAGLEQKLTSTTSQNVDMEPKRKEKGRFEVDLQKFEQKIEQSFENSLEEISDHASVRSKSKQEKKSRRAESVTVRSSRNNVTKLSNELGSNKKITNSSRKRLKARKPALQTFDSTSKKLNNAKSKIDTSVEIKSSKSYMRPTNSSVKKSKSKAKLSAVIPRSVNKEIEKGNIPLSELSKHPNALLILFKNLKSYHNQVML